MEMLWKNRFSTQGKIFWQQWFLVSSSLNLLEQWSFTGGRESSLAISVFLISLASFTCKLTVVINNYCYKALVTPINKLSWAQLLKDL